jgi:hypothetical protein
VVADEEVEVEMGGERDLEFFSVGMGITYLVGILQVLLSETAK